MVRPDDAAIERELIVTTDHLTDETVAGFRAEVERVIFGVSRLVVDPKDFQTTPTSRWRREGWAQRTRGSQPLRVIRRRSGAG